MSLEGFVDNYISELNRFYIHYTEIGKQYKRKYENILNTHGQKDATECQIIDSIFEYDTEGLKRLLKYNSMEDEYYDSENNRTAFATALLKKQNEEGRGLRKSLLNSKVAKLKLGLTSMIPYIKEVLEFRQIGETQVDGANTPFSVRIRESARIKNDIELRKRASRNDRIIKAIHVGKTSTEIAQIMEEGDYDPLTIKITIGSEYIKLFERAERRLKMQRVREANDLIKKENYEGAMNLLNDSQLNYFISQVRKAYGVEGNDYSRLPKPLRKFMELQSYIR